MSEKSQAAKPVRWSVLLEPDAFAALQRLMADLRSEAAIAGEPLSDVPNIGAVASEGIRREVARRRKAIK